MNAIKSFVLLCMVSFISFSVTAPTNAATITQFQNDTDRQGYGVFNGVTQAVSTLTFNLFDSSLGTLTGVDISLLRRDRRNGHRISASTGEIQAISATGRLDWETSMTVQIGSIDQTFTDTDSRTVSCSAGGSPFFCSDNRPPAPGLDISEVLNFSGADLSSFIGIGTFDIVSQAIASGEVTSVTSNTSALVASFNEFLYSEATVNYLFDEAPEIVPVPVPAALPLLVAALVGLVLVRRRRTT